MEGLIENLDKIKEFAERIRKRKGNSYTLDKKASMLYIAIEQIKDETQVKFNKEKLEDVWSEIKVEDIKCEIKNENDEWEEVNFSNSQ